MTGRPLLTLTLPRAQLSRFIAVLQRGVAVPVAAGRSVHGFLTEQLGVAPEYVKGRITTVFLDSQVVDDLERAPLREGSLLALSAAMPGLVGATLRKGGYYAAMRAAITRTAERATPERASATSLVRVKLFNLLLDELGPIVLEHGVVLRRDEALELVGGAHGVGELVAGGEVELRVQFTERATP